MNPNEKTFCVSPFSEVRICADGKLRFCHAADRSYLPDSDNINDISIDEYFNNSLTVSESRTNLLNGKYLDPCHGCYYTEKMNSLSFRMRRNLQAAIFQNDDFFPSFEESYQRLKNFTKPRFYHISLSNLCNMGCMMCDSHGSNLLSKTFSKAGIFENTKKHLMDWTSNDLAWNSFCDHLLNNEHIVCLHFMGGEPLLHKKFYELIDFLIDNDHTDFHLTFVTNGSTYPPELIPKLKKFKSLQIEISIETTKKSNDYIRYPSNTSKIVQNIRNFCQNRDDTTDILLRTVPQILSVHDYTSILNLGLETNTIVDSNFLQEPSFLKPNILSDKEKKIVIKKLKKFVLKHHNKNTVNFRDRSNIEKQISENAQRVINAINEPCNDVNYERKQLIEYCAKIDSVRKQDIRSFIPELESILNRYGYESARYNNKHKFTIYKRD